MAGKPEYEFPDELMLVKPAKWSLVVVIQLNGDTMRFSQLRRAIGGISQKILSGTLRELERDGFIKRTQYATIPPRVEYELTDSGRDLLALANAWRQFIATHHQAVEASRRRYDRERSGGEPPKFILG